MGRRSCNPRTSGRNLIAISRSVRVRTVLNSEPMRRSKAFWKKSGSFSTDSCCSCRRMARSSLSEEAPPRSRRFRGGLVRSRSSSSALTSCASRRGRFGEGLERSCFSPSALSSWSLRRCLLGRGLARTRFTESAKERLSSALSLTPGSHSISLRTSSSVSVLIHLDDGLRPDSLDSAGRAFCDSRTCPESQRHSVPTKCLPVKAKMPRASPAAEMSSTKRSMTSGSFGLSSTLPSHIAPSSSELRSPTCFIACSLNAPAARSNRSRPASNESSASMSNTCMNMSSSSEI
mmetsp:Transcript_123350/g.356500  ORF Transcript_123350/g.356500 Transcript_123350/m.356500 type:complete len:290 (-) Transcript_123350:208-1077(-)